MFRVDLTVLPSNAPDLLSAPTATTPVFIAISLALTIIFFFLFTLTAMRSKLGKMGPFFDKPSVQRYTAWIGLFGFMIGAFFQNSLLFIASSYRQQALQPFWFCACGSAKQSRISTGLSSKVAPVLHSWSQTHLTASLVSTLQRASFYSESRMNLTYLLPSDIRGIRVLRRPPGLLAGQAPCYGDGKSCLDLRGLTIRNSLGHLSGHCSFTWDCSM